MHQITVITSSTVTKMAWLCQEKGKKKKKKALSEILPFLWKNIINSSCSPLWNTGHHTGHHTFR